MGKKDRSRNSYYTNVGLKPKARNGCLLLEMTKRRSVILLYNVLKSHAEWFHLLSNRLGKQKVRKFREEIFSSHENSVICNYSKNVLNYSLRYKYTHF